MAESRNPSWYATEVIRNSNQAQSISTSYANSGGVIAMAAYRPSEQLFARQLLSIRAQSIQDFQCLISVDGDAGPVARMVEEITEGDARFQVLGFENRMGFYLNFQRAVSAVPVSARWVALSDQDDYWYPTKLETLLPFLDQASLAAGQSRVIAHPSGQVIAESTGRRELPVSEFFVENQFTGGAMVFRREVLDLALPFPEFASPTQVHDHWLAVCAAVQNGARLVDVVVQDYVQHDANVIGEAESGFNPLRSLRTARSIAQKFQGSTSPLALLRSIHGVGVGWREVMADSLLTRLPQDPEVRQLASLYGSGAKRKVARTVLSASFGGRIHPRAAAEFLSGLAIAPLVSRKRGAS